MDGLDALDLDDDQVLDEQVDSIAQVEFLSFINHGQTDLRVHTEASFAEFVRQAGVVGTLQQARAQDGMHFHRGTDNGGGDLVTSVPVLLDKTFHYFSKIFLHLWKFAVISQLRTNFADNARESLFTLGAA